MKTVKDVFAEFRNRLNKFYYVNEVEALTLEAACEITGFSKAKLKAFPDQSLSEEQIRALDDILNQLTTGKPIQYVLEKTEFYGLPFMVNPSVLIPRPETEELVEWALSECGMRNLECGSILDIGTGSGCIAISLKKNLPGFDVSAIDVSSAALDTAGENAELNEVKIDFIDVDILNLGKQLSLSHSLLTTHYSLIISNPPYVTVQDKTLMHANVTDFEPHTALFVPEDDPLIFYKAIADFATENLVPGGLLFFEINESYGQQIVEMLAGKLFKNIELRKDMSGKDRMIKADR